MGGGTKTNSSRDGWNERVGRSKDGEEKRRS